MSSASITSALCTVIFSIFLSINHWICLYFCSLIFAYKWLKLVYNRCSHFHQPTDCRTYVRTFSRCAIKNTIQCSKTTQKLKFLLLLLHLQYLSFFFLFIIFLDYITIHISWTSIYSYIYPSFYPSICPSISLSIYLHVCSCKKLS